MNKDEKIEFLRQPALDLNKVADLILFGDWVSGGYEVSAIAERLGQYVQEVDLEYQSIGGFSNGKYL